MRRQLGEISILAHQHDFLHRRFALLELDQLRLEFEAALDFFENFIRGDAERMRHAGARADDIADHAEIGAVDVLEPHGLRIAVKNVGDIGEVGRALADFDLVVAEAFKERAQAIAVEIVAEHFRRRLGVHDFLQRRYARSQSVMTETSAPFQKPLQGWASIRAAPLHFSRAYLCSASQRSAKSYPSMMRAWRASIQPRVSGWVIR